MLIAYYVVSALAIAAMLVSLVLVVRLRRTARGGSIGRVVNVLFAFILLFLAGYLLMPIVPRLPVEAAYVFTAAVFLFGAIFVIIVLRLIGSLIVKVFDELEM